MQINEIQKEHAKWASTNFPTATAWQAILGMVEELGELSHAYLKSLQGIRVNEDHVANQKDAIGDILLYTLHFCTLKGWSLSEILTKTWEQVKQRDWINYPEKGVK